MLTILQLFSIWSKLERWKSSISGCLVSWLEIKKIVILKCLLLFYTTSVNRFSIGLCHATQSRFYMITSWVVALRSSSKAPRWARLAPEKGPCHRVVVCCPSHLLQLSESQWNRCLWGDEMHPKLQHLQLVLVNRKGLIFLHDSAQLHVAQLHVEQPALQKLNGLGYKILPHPDIYLTSCQPTTTSSSIPTTFFRENASTAIRMQKMLLKSLLNPEAQIFMLQK